MKNFLILATCILILSSCSRKVIAPSVIEKTIVKDSIVEIIRDSVITLPADSALIRALLECDSLGQVHIKQLLDYQSGKNVKPPTIIIKDNILTALSSTDSLNIYLALKDRYQYTQTDNTKYEKEVVEVNKLTKWQSFWIILGRVAGVILLLLLCFVGYKFYKKVCK